MAKHILEQALQDANISKRQFAKLIGIKYENVFRFFKSSYDPKLSTLTKWAKALHVKVRDLIKE